MATDTIKKNRKHAIDYVMELWHHLQLRLSELKNKELSFDELSKSMKEKRLILLTSNFYKMLSANSKKTSLSKQSKDNNNKNNRKEYESEICKKAKVILSSLMLIKFPLDVLDVADLKDLDPLSERCYKSAIKMTDTLLTIPKQQPTRLQCGHIHGLIDNYCEAFQLWRSKDIAKVLQSIKNYYEQWFRSYNVLSKSSMNEAHRKVILNTLASNMNATMARMAKLVGNVKASEICKEIQEKVNAEPEQDVNSIHPPSTTGMQRQSNDDDNDQETKEDVAINNNNGNDSNSRPLTIEEQLAAKGIPSKMVTGNALLSPQSTKQKSPNSKDGNFNRIGMETKYVKVVNGKKMLDVDMILKEEASKNYWTMFEKQIGNEDFSHLFELLNELLQRIKKISPAKQHKYLDDMLDVQFIQQTIENGNIDAEKFYGIFYGIWQQIKTLHAPSEDKKWDAWHQSIITEMSDENASWAKLLPNVFNSFFRKLDLLEDRIKAIDMIKENKKKK